MIETIENRSRRAPPTRTAWRLERAANYQTRALASLREARDPARPITIERRRALLLRAWEQLLRARELLEHARRGCDVALVEQVDGHLARLQEMLPRVEQLFHTVEGRMGEA